MPAPRIGRIRRSAATEDGARSAGAAEFVLALVGIAGMVAAVWWIWQIVGPTAYAGGDGKGFLAHIRTYLHYAPACESTTLNPLQGMFNQLKPLNLCFNLGYLPFLLMDFDRAAVVGALASLATLAAATYVVGRSFGLGVGASLLGAQATCLGVGPFVTSAGMFSEFVIVPASAFTLGLVMLASCLVRLVRRAAIGPMAVVGALNALAIGLIAYVDPFLTVGIALGVGVLWACQLAGDGLGPALARIAALAVALALLYAAGTLDFLRLFANYTARWHFLSEQTRYAPELATALFVYPSRAPGYFAILAVGWILLLALGRGRQRWLGIAAIANAAFVLALAAAFLGLRRPWPLPAPIYFEQFSLPLSLLAGAAGFAVLFGRLTADRAAPAVGGVAAIAVGQAMLAFFAIEIAPRYIDRLNEPFPDDKELVSYLEQRIAMPAREAFRGTVAFTFSPNQYNDLLTKISLRLRDIPALDEYGQQITPQMQFFNAYLMADPQVARGTVNNVYPSRPNARIMAAMGVRFLATPPGQALDGAQPVGLFVGSDTAKRPTEWKLWELPDANTGQYSPTDLVVETSAPATIAALADPAFDFRRRALVAEPVPGPLVAARGARLSFDRGALHVTAESDGRSMLLLPAQFTNCWTVESEAPPRLVRADFLFTGLVFERRLDARLRLGFGVLTPGCRGRDIADMRAMGVRAEPLADRTPPDAYAKFFPYSVREPGEVPDAVRRLLAHVDRTRNTECAHDPPVPGAISNWLAPWGIRIPSLRFCP